MSGSLNSLIKKEAKRHILNVLPILLKKDEKFRQEVSIILRESLSPKDKLELSLKRDTQGSKGD